MDTLACARRVDANARYNIVNASLANTYAKHVDTYASLADACAKHVDAYASLACAYAKHVDSCARQKTIQKVKKGA